MMGTISMRKLAQDQGVSPHIVAFIVYGDPAITQHRSDLNPKAISLDPDGIARVVPQIEAYKRVRDSLKPAAKSA